MIVRHFWDCLQAAEEEAQQGDAQLAADDEAMMQSMREEGMLPGQAEAPEAKPAGSQTVCMSFEPSWRP